MNKQKILFYDIETTLLLNYVFSLGKQFVRHNQLLQGYFSRTHIICITYKWGHEKKTHVLDWGQSLGDEKRMVKKFDKLITQADVIIGKNSNRFDNKHINTQRLWYDLDGMPDWIKRTDDLETQMRKYFYLPSNSLDYFSEQLGFGGKRKMEFQDWVSIAEQRMVHLSSINKSNSMLIEVLTGKTLTRINRLGDKAIKKMLTYGKKDTSDTAAIWNKCIKHFDPKHSQSIMLDHLACKTCGSSNIIKNGIRYSGKTKYQTFFCNDHNGYAGRAPIREKSKTVGKIG